ncbi:MAG: hypothetical protein JWP57_2047 [Spirosoma sp.]|nr:hypothetical protein [Spirosoma sp.]
MMETTDWEKRMREQYAQYAEESIATIKRVRQSIVEQRAYFIEQRNFQQAKVHKGPGVMNLKTGRGKAIQYWIDYWKDQIKMADIKLELIDKQYGQ